MDRRRDWMAGEEGFEPLARLESDELLAMYRNADTPRLEDLHGKLAGRVVRIQAPHVRRFVEPVLRWKPLLWHKTFAHENAPHGHGRLVWFDSKTSIGHSRVGDFDAVHIEYGHPILSWE